MDVTAVRPETRIALFLPFIDNESSRVKTKDKTKLQIILIRYGIIQYIISYLIFIKGKKMLDYRMYAILTEESSYDIFRSEVYHFLLFNSVRDFMYQILSYNIIETFVKKEKYAKAYFLLGLFDYYCNEYKVDGSSYFKEYRNKKLKEKQYPDSVIIDCKIQNNQKAILDIEKKCQNNYYSSFFLKYNIYEYKE